MTVGIVMTVPIRFLLCTVLMFQNNNYADRYFAYALIRAILGTIFPVFPRQKHGEF